jgi:hypothetical protein
MENDMTAKIFGKILAEGMSIADCNLENKIESEALEKLKEIKNVVESDEKDGDKIELVRDILDG